MVQEVQYPGETTCILSNKHKSESLDFGGDPYGPKESGVLRLYEWFWDQVSELL